MPAAAPTTAEELLRLKVPHKRTELVRGALVVREPAGYRHGDVAAMALATLYNFVRQHGLGRVVAAETGFTLRRDPDTVRAADVAFIATHRLPPRDTRGFAALAPDLVVEVLSPNDRPGDVLEKTGDWLSAGCRLVWEIDPVRRTGRVYRADGTVVLLGEQDAFDGEEVIPGFRCLLATMLA